MIILASQSGSRRMMLTAAGVEFEAMPAAIDERALEAELGDTSSAAIALALAEAKSLAVSPSNSGRLVLGSDSLIEVDGRRFSKPASREDAAAHLRLFSGRTMLLYSAAALVRDGAIVWRHQAQASLEVRALSEAFIADYLDAEWPAVAACVGVFRIEGRGIQLFTLIEGDHFTILGMPLLPVLSALRALGELPA